MSKPKLTFWDLAKMANKAMRKARKCVKDNDTRSALRYSNIHYRLVKAMVNPNYFLDNSEPSIN